MHMCKDHTGRQRNLYTVKAVGALELVLPHNIDFNHEIVPVTNVFIQESDIQ